MKKLTKLVVQRLFSMFPQGGPGVALLLLRLSVAAGFLINLANRDRVPSGFLQVALVLMICLVSLSLSVGFLTPFLSLIVCVAAAANLLLSYNYGFSSDHLIHLLTIVIAAALALLGPGAYSVDAKLFGRRVTVVRPRKDRNSH